LNINITVNSTPTISIGSISSNTICSGQTVTITPNGGSASNYTIFPGGTSGSSFVVSPTSTTTYTVRGANASGCVSSASSDLVTTITVNTTPNITSSGATSATICSGQSFIVTPSGGGTGTYTLTNTGATSSTNFVLSPTASTNYTIIGANGNGCVSASSTDLNINITVNSTPTVNATFSSNALCSSQNVTITLAGASGTYTLLPGSLTSTSSFVVSPPSGTTIYTVTANNTNGCVSTLSSQIYTTSVSVVTNPTISASFITNTICVGSMATIIPFGASTFTLMPNNISVASGGSFTLTPTVTTTYTINGTATGGCFSSPSTQFVTTIGVNANPTITAVSALSNTLCSGLTTTLTASGASTYTWTNGPTNPNYVVSPNVTTSYTVIATNSSGCSNSSAPTIITVTVLSTPTLALGTSVNTNTLCSGNSATITLGGASAGTTYTLWPDLATNTTSFVVSPTTSTDYTVIATDIVTGCVSTLAQQMYTTSIAVNVTPTITAGFISSTTICSGNTVTITPSGSSTYTLLPDNMTGTDFTVSPLSTTVYTVNGESTAGCISTLSNNLTTTITVNITPTLTASSISANTICSGNSVTITPLGASSYTLFPDNIVGTSFTVSPMATTVYTINGSSSSGCISTALSNLTTTITVNSTPTISLGSISSNTICFGSSAVLTPLGAINYSLLPTNETGTSFTVSPTVSSTYTIIGIDNNGCVSSNTDNLLSTITVSSLSITLSGQQDVLCYGASTGAVSAQVNGGIPTYNYLWNTGAVSSNLASIQSGVYTLTVTDNVNCISTKTVLISEPSSSVSIDSEDVTSSCSNKSNGGITISVSGGTPSYSVIWNTGATELNITNIPSGIYTATVTDNNDCELVSSITVTSLSKTDILCEELFIPEIFSPNGDGQNEKFEIKGIEAYPNNTINIFNRWGSLVYSKNNYKNEWDGKANVSDASGKSTLPAGTYFVVLEFGDGKTQTYKGYVMLEY
jgi:gliding motility-associated-like protein